LFSSRKVLYIDEWSFKLIKISDIILLDWKKKLKKLKKLVILFLGSKTSCDADKLKKDINL